MSLERVKILYYHYKENIVYEFRSTKESIVCRTNTRGGEEQGGKGQCFYLRRRNYNLI